MANRNAPFGLRPLMRTLGGGEPEVRNFNVAVGVAQAKFIHDLMAVVNDGTVTPAITPGTSVYAGVSMGPYAAASVLSAHVLMVSPGALYLIQADSDGLARADVFANVNVAYGAGDSATKHSKTVANAAAATTATLDLRIVGFHEAIDNEEGAYARVIVMLNKSVLQAGADGV